MKHEQTFLKRNKEIMKTSLVGIIAHILFAGFKLIVAFAAGSAAIMADGIESFEEAGSSLITFTGIIFSSKKPDEKHPLGYGRVEAISDLLISSLAIYASFTAIYTAVIHLIHPTDTNYSSTALLILSVSIPVKFLLGKHEKEKGNELSSRALKASGKHSYLSMLLSFSVLAGSIIDIKLGINIEAYIALIISVTGLMFAFSMLKRTVSEMLGERMNPLEIQNIKTSILEMDNVLGIYDLILHNYGQGRTIGSLHIEVPTDLPLPELDHMSRTIQQKVYKEHSIILEAIGIYSRDDKDIMDKEIREMLIPLISKTDDIKSFHGLSIDRKRKCINLDLVISFSRNNINEEISNIRETIEKRYPDFTVNIVRDLDL